METETAVIVTAIVAGSPMFILGALLGRRSMIREMRSAISAARSAIVAAQGVAEQEIERADQQWVERMKLCTRSLVEQVQNVLSMHHLGEARYLEVNDTMRVEILISDEVKELIERRMQ